MSKAQITSASNWLVSSSSVKGAVILVVAKALDVDAENDASVAHVVQPAILDQGRRGDALKRPVIGASGLELSMRLLPEKLAVRLAERHQHTTVAGLLRIAQEPHCSCR